MVSATNINPNQGLFLSQNEGMTGLSETEGFDFMSYLLGLQAGSNTDSTLPEKTSLEGTSLLAPQPEQVEVAEELVVSPEEKLKEKELSQWNPLFPSVTKLEVPTVARQNLPVVIESKEVVSTGSPAMGMTPAMFQWSSSKTNIEQPDTTQETLKPKAAETAMASPKQVAQKYNAFQMPQVNTESKVQAPEIREQASESVPSKVALKPEPVSIEKNSKKREHISSSENPFTLITPMEDSNKVQVTENVMVQPSSEPKPVTTSTVPQLFQNVESMIRTGGGKMTVHLSPPELGQVQIQVTARGKNVEVEMTSDNDQTKSILESNLNDLKSSMHALDLVLHKTEVHVSRETSSWGEGQLASFNQGQPQQSFHQGSMDQRQNQNQGRSFAPDINPATLSRVSAPSTVFRPMAASSRGVDIRI